MRKNCPDCHHLNHAGRPFCEVRSKVSPPRVGFCGCKYGAPRPRMEAVFKVNKKKVREAVAALQKLVS